LTRTMMDCQKNQDLAFNLEKFLELDYPLSFNYKPLDIARI